MGVKEIPLSDKAKEIDDAYREAMGANAIEYVEDDIENTQNVEHDHGEDQRMESLLNNRARDDDNRPALITNWTDWLKEGAFYNYGGVYMFARLGMNVTMVSELFFELKLCFFIL